MLPGQIPTLPDSSVDISGPTAFQVFDSEAVVSFSCTLEVIDETFASPHQRGGETIPSVDELFQTVTCKAAPDKPGTSYAAKVFYLLRFLALCSTV